MQRKPFVEVPPPQVVILRGVIVISNFVGTEHGLNMSTKDRFLFISITSLIEPSKSTDYIPIAIGTAPAGMRA
jgi:hypothetical protein